MGASSIFGNETQHEGRWVPEPETRGTFSLIFSCVVTLSLCVWSSVHLNVPEYKGGTKQIWRKIGWVIIGCLAPEFIVFVAWHQRHEAKKLLRLMRRKAGQKAPESSFIRFRKMLDRSRRMSGASIFEMESSHGLPSNSSFAQTTWTLTHGFYAAMGGFAIDASKAVPPFLPTGRDHVAFGKRGIKYLLELGYEEELANISAEDIRDKGKSSRIAKIFIGVQTLWFCTQLVARLTEHLPISLLELNTFVHGICTLFSIYFWWEKPQDIERPTLLSMNRIQPLCALLWMNSDISYGKGQSEAGLWTTEIDNNANELRDNPETSSDKRTGSELVDEIAPDPPDKKNSSVPDTKLHSTGSASIEQDISLSEHENSCPMPNPHDSENAPEPPSGADGVGNSSGDLLIKKGCLIPNTIFAPSRFQAYDGVFVSPLEVTRLSLASKASELHPNLLKSIAPSSILGTERYLTSRVPEFQFNLTGGAFMVILTTGVAYGGLHCLAWNSQSFASGTERLLWRMSCLILMGTFLVVMLVFIPLSFEPELHPRIKQVLKRIFNSDGLVGNILQGLLWIPFLLLAVGGTLAFIFARAYLLIECFINVGHLDDRVFILPTWINYLPHIV